MPASELDMDALPPLSVSSVKQLAAKAQSKEGKCTSFPGSTSTYFRSKVFGKSLGTHPCSVGMCAIIKQWFTWGGDQRNNSQECCIYYFQCILTWHCLWPISTHVHSSQFLSPGEDKLGAKARNVVFKFQHSFIYKWIFCSRLSWTTSS